MDLILKILLILLHIKWQKVITAVTVSCAACSDTGFHTVKSMPALLAVKFSTLVLLKADLHSVYLYNATIIHIHVKINVFCKNGWDYPVHSPGWLAAAQQSQGDPPAAPFSCSGVTCPTPAEIADMGPGVWRHSTMRKLTGEQSPLVFIEN